MREILFRGKRVDNGEWVYGDFSRYSEEKSIIMADLLEQEDYWVSSETVGQFTGLKDKNGVEVYEGDVVLALCAPSGKGARSAKMQRAVIVWRHNGWNLSLIDVEPGKKWGAGYAKWGYKGNAFEVIGNIHDKEEQP